MPEVMVNSSGALEQMEASLRENLDLNWVILNSLPAQLAVLDRAGSTIVVNPAWREMSQDEEKLTLACSSFGENYLEACRLIGEKIGDDAAAAWREIRAVLHGEIDYFEVVYHGGVDGSPRWFAMRVTPLNGENGGAVLLHYDITERKDAEDQVRALNAGLEQRILERTAQLAAANQELESFCYAVSHDLRAPLRSVNGFTRAALEDCASVLGDRGSAHLTRVLAASHRMGDLIDALLNLSRVIRVDMQRENVDIGAMAREIAAELQQETPRNVEFIVAPDLKADGDPRLLRILLDNLIGNAWKYSGRRQEARIEIGALPAGGRPTYFVRDNGAGFDMAYSSKLFGPFQRLHSPSEFEGTGVGLATVQRIVNRHGGSIWAEGEVDAGATFFFTLGQPRD